MKPIYLMCLGLALALSAPAAAGEDLWPAVLQLRTPGLAGQAEQRLRAAGPEGLELLVRAARLGDARLSLDRAAFASGCFSLLVMHVPAFQAQERMGEADAAGAAADLAGRLLSEQPELAEAWLGSEVSTERQLGLIGLCANTERLATALDRLLEAPPDLVLAHPAMLIHWHYRTQTDGHSGPLGERLRDASDELQLRCSPRLSRAECRSSGFVASPLVQELADGRAKFHSSLARRGQQLFRLLRADRTAIALDAECLIEAYSAVHQLRGPDRSLAGLLVDIATDPLLGAELRRRAAEGVSADLRTFSDFDRQRLAAGLVNAGFEVPVAIEYDDGDRLPDVAIHEAAIRQGSPTARQAVIDTLICPRTAEREVALLGYSDQPEAADYAARLAVHCPGSRNAATAALIRLGDSRARSLLFAILVGSWSFGFAEDALVSALRERGGPELRELIDQLAASGNLGARRLRAALRVDSNEEERR